MSYEKFGLNKTVKNKQRSFYTKIHEIYNNTCKCSDRDIEMASVKLKYYYQNFTMFWGRSFNFTFVYASDAVLSSFFYFYIFTILAYIIYFDGLLN